MLYKIKNNSEEVTQSVEPEKSEPVSSIPNQDEQVIDPSTTSVDDFNKVTTQKPNSGTIVASPLLMSKII